MGPALIEMVQKKNSHTLILLDFKGKQLECASSWGLGSGTLRYELSSQFGCLCDCNFCEYSYRYRGDCSVEEMDEQFLVLRANTEKSFRDASRIVISFCRMGEPTLNSNVPLFIEKIYKQLISIKNKLVFEVATVLPEEGTAIMLRIREMAREKGIKVRPVITLNSLDMKHRELVTGMEMPEIEKVAFLLRGWHSRPIVKFQPYETGLIVSWDVKKYLSDIAADFVWQRIDKTMSSEAMNYKFASFRTSFDDHIKIVTRGMKRLGFKVEFLNEEFHGISYPSQLGPGKVFSLMCKDKLIRTLAHLKARK